MTDGAKRPKPAVPGGRYIGHRTIDALVEARPDLFANFDALPPSESTYSGQKLVASAPHRLKVSARALVEEGRQQRATKAGKPKSRT